MKLPIGLGDIPIIDIQQKQLLCSLRNSIHDKLHPEEGQAKRLPTLLLYDELGLRLFEDITYLDEYYLTNAEIELLKHHADSIAKLVRTGSQLIELGSGYVLAFHLHNGSMKKVKSRPGQNRLTPSTVFHRENLTY